MRQREWRSSEGKGKREREIKWERGVIDYRMESRWMEMGFERREWKRPERKVGYWKGVEEGVDWGKEYRRADGYCIWTNGEEEEKKRRTERRIVSEEVSERDRDYRACTNYSPLSPLHIKCVLLWSLHQLDSFLRWEREVFHSCLLYLNTVRPKLNPLLCVSSFSQRPPPHLSLCLSLSLYLSISLSLPLSLSLSLCG